MGLIIERAILWIFLNICIHEKCGGYYPFPPWDRNTRGGGGFMTKTAIHAKQRLTRSSQTAMIMLDLHQRWLSITLWLFATWSLYYNACPSFKQRLTQRSSTFIMIMLDLCHIMMWWLLATWNFYDTLSAIHSKQRLTQRSSTSMIVLDLCHIMTFHDVVTFCNVKLLWHFVCHSFKTASASEIK